MTVFNPTLSESSVKWPSPLERWEWGFAQATAEGLSPAASLMLLRACFKDGGNGFYESIPTMEKAMPLRETTIRRGLAECAFHKLLSAEARKGGATCYRLLMDATPPKTETPPKTDTPSETAPHPSQGLDPTRLKECTPPVSRNAPKRDLNRTNNLNMNVGPTEGETKAQGPTEVDTNVDLPAAPKAEGPHPSSEPPLAVFPAPGTRFDEQGCGCYSQFYNSYGQSERLPCRVHCGRCRPRLPCPQHKAEFQRAARAAMFAADAREVDARRGVAA